MDKIDVLILYEHVDREVDVACALKYLAKARHNLRVEIIQHPLGPLQSDLPIGDIYPRVVVLPHAYWSSIYTPYLLDWPDAIYLNLMWEQIFYPGNAISKLPIGNFSIKHVLHHVWGNFAADYLTAAGVSENNIVRNGNPAYQLYDAPYRNYYQSRTELAQKYALDESARWVFFPENYNWAFFTDKKLQDAVNNGQSADEVRTMRDFCRASFSDVAHWCSQLAQHSGVEVIVRPRPSTPVQELEQAILQVVPSRPPRLKIIKTETVREWIMASDSVVSSYSTSLIEAAIAGKPAHMLEPHPIPPPLQMHWHQYVPRLKTYAEFAAYELEQRDHTDRRLGQWARTEMLSRGDVLMNLVDLLADLVAGRRAPPPRVPRPDILRPVGGAPMRGGWLEFQYHRLRRKYQHWRVKSTQKMAHHDSFYERDLVPQTEIQRRVDHWRAVLE